MRSHTCSPGVPVVRWPTPAACGPRGAVLAAGARSLRRAQGWQVWGLGTGEPGSRPRGGQGKGSQKVPARRPRWALDRGHSSEPETGPREACDKAQVRSWGPLDGQGTSQDGSGLRPDPCGRKGVGGRGERRPRGWAARRSLACLRGSRKAVGPPDRRANPAPSVLPPGAPGPSAGQRRVPEGQPGPRGDGRGRLHALRRASAKDQAQLALLPRWAGRTGRRVCARGGAGAPPGCGQGPLGSPPSDPAGRPQPCSCTATWWPASSGRTCSPSP